MGPPTIQFVGAPCGQHGPYTFYKALKYQRDDKLRVLTLGEFFLVKISKDAPACIGELQLVWEDKNNEDVKMTSLRLYFLPEYTPDGRLEIHGEDEVLAESDKMVMKADDLVGWISDDEGWTIGSGGICHKDVCKSEEEDAFSKMFAANNSLQLKDVKKEQNLAGNQCCKSNVVILSYSQYCRYKAVLKRLENVTDKWLLNAVVCAVGGFTVHDETTRILFCRDTFEHPELQDHDLRQDHLAPNLKGRPRKKRWKASGIHESDSNDSDFIPDGMKPSKSFLNIPRKPSHLAYTPGKIQLSHAKGKLRPNKEYVSPEEADFLDALYNFMKSRNTPVERIPNLGFKQLDVYHFYTMAQKLGGYEKITHHRLWKQLYDKLGGNPGSTSAATCTRRHYERLLLAFERHQRGEEHKPIPIPPVKHRKSTLEKIAAQQDQDAGNQITDDNNPGVKTEIKFGQVKKPLGTLNRSSGSSSSLKSPTSPLKLAPKLNPKPSAQLFQSSPLPLKVQAPMLTVQTPIPGATPSSAPTPSPGSAPTPASVAGSIPPSTPESTPSPAPGSTPGAATTAIAPSLVSTPPQGPVSLPGPGFVSVVNLPVLPAAPMRPKLAPRPMHHPGEKVSLTQEQLLDTAKMWDDLRKQSMQKEKNNPINNNVRKTVRRELAIRQQMKDHGSLPGTNQQIVIHENQPIQVLVEHSPIRGSIPPAHISHAQPPHTSESGAVGRGSADRNIHHRSRESTSSSVGFSSPKEGLASAVQEIVSKANAMAAAPRADLSRLNKGGRMISPMVAQRSSVSHGQKTPGSGTVVRATTVPPLPIVRPVVPYLMNTNLTVTQQGLVYVKQEELKQANSKVESNKRDSSKGSGPRPSVIQHTQASKRVANPPTPGPFAHSHGIVPGMLKRSLGIPYFQTPPQAHSSATKLPHKRDVDPYYDAAKRQRLANNHGLNLPGHSHTNHVNHYTAGKSNIQPCYDEQPTDLSVKKPKCEKRPSDNGIVKPRPSTVSSSHKEDGPMNLTTHKYSRIAPYSLHGLPVKTDSLPLSSHGTLQNRDQPYHSHNSNINAVGEQSRNFHTSVKPDSEKGNHSLPGHMVKTEAKSRRTPTQLSPSSEMRGSPGDLKIPVSAEYASLLRPVHPAFPQISAMAIMPQVLYEARMQANKTPSSGLKDVKQQDTVNNHQKPNAIPTTHLYPHVYMHHKK